MSILMADVVYFDANPFVYWAAGRAGSKETQDARAAESVDALISGDDDLYLSPITLVEFNTTLYKLVRTHEEPHAAFGPNDATAAEGDLMKWISSGRIVVSQLGQRAFEVGMSYVASSTRQHGRRVHAWDAIHLFEACRLARTLGRRVVIATSDSDFDTLLEIYPEFRVLVEVRDYAS
jgi:predicted nucleic acid-binding protein